MFCPDKASTRNKIGSFSEVHIQGCEEVSATDQSTPTRAPGFGRLIPCLLGKTLNQRKVQAYQLLLSVAPFRLFCEQSAIAGHSPFPDVEMDPREKEIDQQTSK